MEQGRYNAGNSQMGKGCITYGVPRRNGPYHERAGNLPLPSPLLKGTPMIPSSFVRDIKVRRGAERPLPPLDRSVNCSHCSFIERMIEGSFSFSS